MSKQELNVPSPCATPPLFLPGNPRAGTRAAQPGGEIKKISVTPLLKEARRGEAARHSGEPSRYSAEHSTSQLTKSQGSHSQPLWKGEMGMWQERCTSAVLGLWLQRRQLLPWTPRPELFLCRHVSSLSLLTDPIPPTVRSALHCRHLWAAGYCPGASLCRQVLRSRSDKC